MAGRDRMILEGGYLFIEYRRLHERATASSNTRAEQLAQIEEHQSQIQILTERNVLERERTARIDREMRKTLEKLQRNGHVMILCESDIALLNHLYDEEGYRPRIYCPVAPLRQDLRDEGFYPYPYPFPYP